MAQCLGLRAHNSPLLFLKKSHSDKYSKSQVRVALSLDCIIISIIFSEHYKHNSSPNTLFILDRFIDELSILKDIGSYYHNWLNRSLSHIDLLILKLHVPKHPNFIRTIEQRVIDLLRDNNSHKPFFSFSFLDAKLRFMVNQNWSHILDNVSLDHLVRPPETFDQVVFNNLSRNGYIDEFKVDCILVLDGIIPANF